MNAVSQRFQCIEPLASDSFREPSSVTIHVVYKWLYSIYQAAYLWHLQWHLQRYQSWQDLTVGPVKWWSTRTHVDIPATIWPATLVVQKYGWGLDMRKHGRRMAVNACEQLSQGKRRLHKGQLNFIEKRSRHTSVRSRSTTAVMEALDDSPNDIGSKTIHKIFSQSNLAPLDTWHSIWSSMILWFCKMLKISGNELCTLPGHLTYCPNWLRSSFIPTDIETCQYNVDRV